MTSLADRTVTALRATHDGLADHVPELTDDQLTGPSGAAEWSLAQVLSHLGSGAEIGLATLRSTLDGTPAPGQDFNQGVWDRWNAMTPREQADGFVEHDAALVAAYEAVPADQRESVQVDLGFTPAPLAFASYAGLRLNESALHGWDARVALDPEAALTATEASLLAEHLSGGLGFLLGFIGKADLLGEPVVVGIDGSGYAITVADRAALTAEPVETTATLTGPLEAAVRLLAGRLTADHTPAGVQVTGNTDLAGLRTVFPGY